MTTIHLQLPPTAKDGPRSVVVVWDQAPAIGDSVHLEPQRLQYVYETVVGVVKERCWFADGSCRVVIGKP